ncbi:optic atrophy 3 protein-domain-containing protein [Filobasidium floriforme]|uniref:optic atrophy 3 protein-domain-containing protein n=1 Tax=Filobasidium floriforme TaxID=5210 RepID=UPI001E8DBD21|nr:optic atrophy 3 protein-domain-containing protein [Filobasidium floriforme]KAH8090463.1 optic atrophy 3 protein-domain-containing protein [Filobasidium floriforme]
MATVKLASLAIRTAAKPVASWLKSQATQHERFRTFCINWAQRMHRMEARMRLGLYNAPLGDIKPLNETRAIQNGANNLAEVFLFGVAATLILGETYRGSRKVANRRDTVDDKLDDLREDIERLQKRWQEEEIELERRANEAEKRNAELQSIIQAVVDAGTRNGWLAGHLTVGSGDGVDNGNSSKQSITRTLPVLDLTAWETTPKAPATNNLLSSESQHVIASDLNSKPQSETTSIA